MLFNSFVFAAFLPTVFVLFWGLRRAGLRAQNVLLLLASYVFYGWWDWRFLSLIVVSSAVDYVVAQRIVRTSSQVTRRRWLWLSLGVNLGSLGTFKYCDFFVTSAVEALGAVGVAADPVTLGLVLPVGISFYTFQTLSYTIDVYRGRAETTDDPVAFFAFVSFFPQLVAGPIERARNLLPQFLEQRRFDRDAAADGMRQALWGLFKKVVIADNLSRYVTPIFDDPGAHGSLTIALGVAYFAVQIYCDFSGYSDIAIGTARLFGFRLSRNFAFPYFSRDIGEFWRRWHISLSSWFRDYLYIPLGGSRGTRALRIRNVLITFTVSGLWHGANWTFVVWGLLHGLLFVPGLLLGRRPRAGVVAESGALPSLRDMAGIGLTFTAVCVGWVFFRASSVGAALDLLAHLGSFDPSDAVRGRSGIPYCAVVFVVEWLSRREQHGLQIARLAAPLRWALYWLIAGAILMWGNTGHVPFIYFQF